MTGKKVPMVPTLPESKFVIYGLWCLCHPDDGIRYVGQTAGGERKRLRDHLGQAKHRRNRGLPLSHSQRWIFKHGFENIAISVLEVCLDSDDLNAVEPRWIASFDNLTNVEAGGKAARGHARSEEARAKIRGVNNPMYGKHRKELMQYARSFQGAPSEATRTLLGSYHRGEKNAHSRLTESDVIEIRGRYTIGYGRTAALAREYGVSTRTIRLIVSRKTWAHVA